MSNVTAGQRLGPYEVASLIGAGGMGEVYKALDTRLNRTVAIKVSREQFSERFEREARAIAALNHPNICTLYDVGPNYLVMELVEGPTLADRIGAGAIPLDEALEIARQIGEALEAAHEQGIVHRDLKPGNVKIKPDGLVKVLDFGLAKIAGAVAAQASADSPTISMSATQAGVILGTAAYMAPEQARGKPVDKRADIWAFGVVLYEMVAGRQLFQGEDVTETLATVIKGEPKWDGIPANVQRLLKSCLEKDPKRRLRDIGDAWRLLEEAPGVIAPSGGVLWTRLGIGASIVAAVAIVAVSALAFVHFLEKPPAGEVMRFQISPPAQRNFHSSALALSPDGRRIAFNTIDPEGRNQLWVRGLDSLESRPLAGTDGAILAFWSPDGRFLGFEQQGKLRKIDVSGGVPQTLCDVRGDFRGGAWSPEGVIVFGYAGSGLWRVAAAGGVPSEVTKIETSRGEIFHASPNFFPDGRHFLYSSIVPGKNTHGIYIGSLDSRPEVQSSRRLMPTTSSGVSYAPEYPGSSTGHILFPQESSLMAQPFDVRRMEMAGEAVPVVDSMGSGSGNRWSVSSGILAYRSGTRFGGLESQLTWFDREGKPLGTAGEPGQYASVSLSPDGSRVAFGRLDTQVRFGGSAPYDIWVHEFGRTTTRLTTDPALDDFATWSPDGSRIVFSSLRNRAYHNLYQKAASGAGNEELLFESNEDKFPQGWSRDGRYLLYSTGSRTEAGSWDLRMLPLTPGNPVAGRPEPYLKTAFSESQGRFSPDSRFVAYRSDASGKSEVYVQTFPDASGGKWTISTAGRSAPRWRRDGKELFYISADSKMMAVEVSTSPVFRAGIPRVLFPASVLDPAATTNRTRYDVTADGKKFLINSVLAGAAAPAVVPITVMLNWTALLRKK